MSSFTEQLAGMGRAITGTTFLLRTSEPMVRRRTLKKMSKESENLLTQTSELSKELESAKKGSLQAQNANIELGARLESQKDLRSKMATMDATPENLAKSREASLAYSEWEKKRDEHLRRSSAIKEAWKKRKEEYQEFLKMPISGGPSIESAVTDEKKRKELFELYRKGGQV